MRYGPYLVHLMFNFKSNNLTEAAVALFKTFGALYKQKFDGNARVKIGIYFGKFADLLGSIWDGCQNIWDVCKPSLKVGNHCFPIKERKK